MKVPGLIIIAGLIKLSFVFINAAIMIIRSET